ncbi:MAG: hypothetical protein AAF236_11545 [Verrucomicrobiota bacterium]
MARPQFLLILSVEPEKIAMDDLPDTARYEGDPGPFDGIRLGYNVLKNPIERSEHFIKSIKTLSERLPVKMVYRGWLGGLEQVKRDIQAIESSWRDEGIEVGSHEALAVDH